MNSDYKYVTEVQSTDYRHLARRYRKREENNWITYSLLILITGYVEVPFPNMAETADETGIDVWNRKEKLNNNEFRFEDVDIEVSLGHQGIFQ